MSVSQPKQLHQFLAELNVKAKKSLSQNFLIDGNILRKIAKQAQIQPGDHVLEIGPGPGALTEILLAQKAHVVAVEKDRAFAASLLRLQTPEGTLEVYEEDILKFPLDCLKSKGQKFKVVANLPYQLTTPILGLIVPRNDLFSSITIMVQDEVARRMVAGANTEDYSSLSVFLQFYADVKYAFSVSRHCFFPAPKVTSAIVHLDLRPNQYSFSPEDFFSLVRHCFNHRRKMMRAILKHLFPKEVIEAVFESLGLSSTLRPENLNLDEWVKLHEQLNQVGHL